MFDEQEDAFTSSSAERVETVEFPDETKEPEQVDKPQMTAVRTDSLGIVQDTDGKSNTPKILWTFSLSLPKEISRCHSWWLAVRYQCPSFYERKRLLLTWPLLAGRRQPMVHRSSKYLWRVSKHRNSADICGGRRSMGEAYRSSVLTNQYSEKS